MNFDGSAMTLDMEDPRHRNAYMDHSSVAAYMSEYAARLKAAIDGISSDAVELLCANILNAATADKQIFVAGNGGSAAVAEHLCCDWTKGTNCASHPVIACRSLTSNIPLYTAVANDYGFERVFEAQLDLFGGAGDVLIAISSSGNSQNILNAAVRAKELGMFVAGFTGFSGGKLAQMADASIHVAVDNYGVVEDAHQAIMHIVAQYIACCRDNDRAR